MHIHYTHLTGDNIDQYRQSYGETLNILVPSKDITHTRFKKYLEHMLTQGSHIIVAVNDHEKVIGALTVLIERKLTRWGCKAAHLEEIAVHPDRQWQWIGGQLIREAIVIAKQQWCYKIVGETSEDLISRYEKSGFESKERSFKMYL